MAALRRALGVTVVLGLAAGWAGADPSDGVDQDDSSSQEEEAEKKSFSQELVVTASHPELPAEVLFSGREIEQHGSEDIGYFLRSQPGVTSTRRGAIGLDPQVRGLQETQVGIFVDGTRTFAAGPARMDSDMAHVSPRAVERMRVIKGPYALTWGAGTLSAIQLDTFKPSFRGPLFLIDGRAGAAYGGNASTSDGYFGLWGSDESVRFQTLAQIRSGGDYEDGGGNTIPGDFDSNDARWSVGARMGDRGLVEYVGGYQSQEDIDYPGRLLDADYFKTRSHSVEASWNLDGPSVSTLFTQMFTNRKDHRMNNDEKPTARPNPNRLPPFGLDVALPTESNTLGGRLSLSGGGNELRWTVGADFYSLEQTARRFISRRDTGMLLFEDIVWPDAEIDDLGTYLQLIRQGPRFTLAGTVRVDFVDVATGDVSTFFLENTEGALDRSETNTSYALSGRFRLSDRWALTTGVGQAVRTAAVLERFSDRFPSSKFQIAAEFMGDPGLDPEESLQADIGLEYRSHRVSFGIDAFYRTIDNYITVSPDPDLPRRLPLSPPVVYRYISGDEAEFHGGELRLDHALNDLFAWRAAASYIRGDDTLFDEPVFGLAPLTGWIGITLTPGSVFSFDVNVTTVDRQDRVAAARLERPTPGYSFVDLLMAAETNAWRWTLGVNNLGDELYSNHLNSLDPFTGDRIPEVGFNVHASVEYSF